MSFYGKSGITSGEANKLLEESSLLPIWNGSSRPGDLSGHSVLTPSNEYGDILDKHTLRFETQAGYMAFISVLEAAVQLGYREAGERMNKAL